MEEGHHHEGEIVIRITPRNLERIIYILVIIGLLVTALVGFRRTSPNCPVVECEEPENTTNDVSGATTTDDDTTTDDTDATDDDTDDDTTPPAIVYTGEVDFLFTDVTLCILNETTDKGKFDSVSIYIKNGLERQLNAEIQFYLWESGSVNEIEDRATRIEDISIMAGASYTHTFTKESNRFKSSGIFVDIDEPKKIKAVLIDSDLSTELGEKIITGETAEVDC